MSKACSRSEGNVYYNNDDVLHIKSFQNVSGTLCKHDERTRFAYLVVSKAQAKEIAGSLENNKKVLSSLKSFYKSYLVDAVAIENQSINQKQYSDFAHVIRDRVVPIKEKDVHLFNVFALNSSEKGSLKAKKFYDAARHYEDIFDKSSEKKNLSYLHKDVKDCYAELKEEKVYNIPFKAYIDGKPENAALADLVYDTNEPEEVELNEEK